MSGILGLVGFSATSLCAREAALREKLCRFAWDRWEWWQSSENALALGRVDIGVLNVERQPVVSQDGQVVVMLSGELYATEALRAELTAKGFASQNFSEPEIVLNAYLAYGSGAFARLEGAYHVVVYDQTLQRLFISNDRFGLVPLYWARYGAKFVFGPEVKVVLDDPEFRRRLNHVAVAEFVRFQHLLGEKTFFEGVSLLPAASVLTYDVREGSVDIHPYWTFAQVGTCDPATSYQDIIQEASQLFQSAVDRLSTGEQRIGLYLSGGLDSRLIAGCLAKSRTGFPTITYGHRDAADVEIAGRIAGRVGSDHHWFEFSDGRWVLDKVDLHLDLTEGYHSWIHGHGMSTLADAREWMDVNLSGFGVDTGLGGLFVTPSLNEVQDDVAFHCRLFRCLTQDYTWPGLEESEAAAIWSDSWRETMRDLAYRSLLTESQRLAAYSYPRRAALFLLLQHNRRMIANYMVFGGSHLAFRCPGYDYALFDFVYSLPPQIRANRELEKAVIRALCPELALVPFSKDGLLFTDRKVRRVAQHIAVRVKQRINRHVSPIFKDAQSLYADYEGWLRTDLREWAEGLLLDGRLADRGMFNQDTVRSLLARHMSGKEIHTIGKVASLMTLEMMMRKYLD